MRHCWINPNSFSREQNRNCQFSHILPPLKQIFDPGDHMSLSHPSEIIWIGSPREDDFDAQNLEHTTSVAAMIDVWTGNMSCWGHDRLYPRLTVAIGLDIDIWWAHFDRKRRNAFFHTLRRSFDRIDREWTDSRVGDIGTRVISQGHPSTKKIVVTKIVVVIIEEGISANSVEQTGANFAAVDTGCPGSQSYVD